MKNKKSESLYNLFWLFLIGCVAGWFIELGYTYITKGVVINHSALVVGPFNVAYGIGAVLLTSLLYQFQNDRYWKLFVIGFVGGSLAEYIMSWGMELVLGFTAWDYSHLPLNINGRICLLFSIFWGILAIVWAKVIYPKLISIINKIDKKTGKKLLTIISIFLVLDLGLTISAVIRAKEHDRGIPPRNSYEKILDETFNSDYLNNMFCGNWG